MKNIEIIGGGTVSHVRNHLALCAPAYGTTARLLEDLLVDEDEALDYGINVHLTKMADRHSKDLIQSQLKVQKLSILLWIYVQRL